MISRSTFITWTCLVYFRIDRILPTTKSHYISTVLSLKMQNVNQAMMSVRIHVHVLGNCDSVKSCALIQTNNTTPTYS